MNGTIPYQPYGISSMMIVVVLALTIIIEGLGVSYFARNQKGNKLNWFSLVAALNLLTFIIGIIIFTVVGL